MTPEGLETVASPGLLFDCDRIQSNLEAMVEVVGGEVSLLRPHSKTHKCAEILELQKRLGIDRVKCATVSEAEQAAQVGIPDILLAYPALGPNADRITELAITYPESRFSTLIDSTAGLESLAGEKDGGLAVYLDLDVGMHRTGIPPGPKAIDLVRAILAAPGLEWAGVHAYDGHIHHSDPVDRKKGFQLSMKELEGFLRLLAENHLHCPAVVSGGSPTFALHAEQAAASPIRWECSPGTTVLWDAGYGQHFPDLPFAPAAFLLTRVVSHPGDDRVCLDLGHKAVSAENPIENRVRFPDAPAHDFVSQSEEHLVLRIDDRKAWEIGREIVGIPYHVCPTVALHAEARLIRSGVVTPGSWKIAARDRSIGC